MAAAAIVVAAGSGERLGADRPKAFVLLAGRPMVEWSLDALAAAGIAEIVVACPEGWSVEREGVTCVRGGDVRSASVRNALAATSAGADVVVHDAARPLTPPELFRACLEQLGRFDAAIAAAPVTDTVKEVGPNNVVQRTLDRSRLWAVQTPQAFRRDALERALAVSPDMLAKATDDAWLVEAQGGRVVVVESSPANIKVTTPFDLSVAAAHLG